MKVFLKAFTGQHISQYYEVNWEEVKVLSRNLILKRTLSSLVETGGNNICWKLM